VRTENPGRLIRSVEEALRPLDPQVRPNSYVVQRDVDKEDAERRSRAWLAGPVAMLALVLAALGVYGVTAFVVSRRRQEVSVRMALGASGADVRRLLIRDSLRPVLIGLAAGTAVALAVAKIFASLLPGISPFDPLAIGTSLVVLLAASLGAVLGPARSASRLDPAAILRTG
jgi:ABC-type antimicrobial peptide transport system permease subunit